MVHKAASNQGVSPIGGWIHAEDFISPSLKNAGSADVNVDGSGTPVTFSYSPPAPNAASIARLIMYLETAGAMDSILFGDLTALTNGIDIQITDNGTTDVIETWKTNKDILQDMYDFGSAGVLFGKTNRVATGRWTYARATGGSRGLYVPKGGSFEAVVNDNLTGLTFLHFHIQGYLAEG